MLVLSCSAHGPKTVSYQSQAILAPRKDTDGIVFRVLFRSGSIDDPDNRYGLTALAARVMAEGGTQKLDSSQLLRALYPMAAELDVHVDKEQTVFIGRVHRDNLVRFLDIFTDVILHPRWDAKEFERIRDEMQSDITQRLRTSDDENLSKEALGVLLYGGHPYGHFSSGSVNGLRAATLAETRAHAAKVFGRSRLVIGVGGAISPADPMLAELEGRLSALPAGGPLSGALPRAPQPSTRLLFVEKESASTAVAMGYPWEVSRAHPDWPAIVVAFSALGEHRQSSGRLYNQLRELRGLNYGDYAYPEHFIQEGDGKLPLVNIARRQQGVTIWLRPVENKNRLFALRAALALLRGFATEGLLPDEIERTKKFLVGSSRLWDLTDSRRLGYLLDERFYGTPSYVASLRERIAHVTVAEVNSAIRRHFNPSKLAIVVVTKDAAKLRDVIASGKPTPIAYPTPKPAEVLEEDKVFAQEPWNISSGEMRIVRAEELFEQ